MEKRGAKMMLLKDLFEDVGECLIDSIATPKRVAVLHFLIDAGGPLRHKHIAAVFIKSNTASSGEISRILSKLVNAGLARKNEDGTFEPTKLGRIVGKWIKLFILWRAKEDPVGRAQMRADFNGALSLLNIPSRTGEEEDDEKRLEEYLEELKSGIEFLEEIREELKREAPRKRKPSALGVAWGASE